MLAVMAGRTVTDIGEELAEHPAALVTFTVKLADAVTVMLCVVEPSDQSQLLPAEAFSITLLPGQKVVTPEGVITALGNALTFTTAA